MEDNKINKKNMVEQSGIAYGNVGVSETTYGINKFHGSQGHGFAAERAEHIYDLYHREEAKILGDNNVKNGADRLVNGTEIQSKYCRSGTACIQECFENGSYKYYSENGKPMLIEVPSDMYDDAVNAMRRRIANQEIKGVTNPQDAEKLVKKGHFTYAQAKKIAQPGTIESLKFDAANGMVVAGDAMGITGLITFATSLWNGAAVEDALKNAAMSGLKVGGVSFITTIISSQIARTTASSTYIQPAADFLLSKMGPTATSYIANAFRNGTNIYKTEAMKNVSKLLAGNMIASTVSLIVLSAGDIINAFRGRISVEQLIKDVSVTGASIAGGNAGWIVGNSVGGAIGGVVGGTVTGGATGGTGTAAGAKVGAEIGAKVGGFIGSVLCGTTAGAVTHGVLDEVIEDDAVKIMRIVEQEFVSISEQYLLTENEVYSCLTLLKERLTPKELKDIFASDNQEVYVQDIIMDSVNPILRKRAIVSPVKNEDILLGVRLLIEDAINGRGIFGNDTMTEYAGLIGSMESVAQEYTEFALSMKKQDDIHQNLKSKSMEMNQELKSLYDSI